MLYLLLKENEINFSLIPLKWINIKSKVQYRFVHTRIPVQVTPSPVKPTLHPQENDPMVLVQFA